MRTKFKPWAEPYLKEHPEVQIAKEDYHNLNNIDLEIGAGKGAFLIKKAIKNPTFSFVGIEKNVSCSGFIAKKLVEQDIQNGKLIFDDAFNVVLALKDKSINNIFLNFSDPWPKKRHNKRRLTTERFLKEYFRILKDDGLIIQKTDNEDLFNYSKELFVNNSFELIYTTNDYLEVDPDDETTEYEDNFRKMGKPIYRLKARKVLR